MEYIWFVTNGYRGNGYVTAIVIAENEEEALVNGKEALREENKKTMAQGRHEEIRWLSELNVERIDLPYVTEIG